MRKGKAKVVRDLSPSRQRHTRFIFSIVSFRQSMARERSHVKTAEESRRKQRSSLLAGLNRYEPRIVVQSCFVFLFAVLGHGRRVLVRRRLGSVCGFDVLEKSFFLVSQQTWLRFFIFLSVPCLSVLFCPPQQSLLLQAAGKYPMPLRLLLPRTSGSLRQLRLLLLSLPFLLLFLFRLLSLSSLLVLPSGCDALLLLLLLLSPSTPVAEISLHLPSTFSSALE